jgi:ribosome biogenesis GTPase A
MKENNNICIIGQDIHIDNIRKVFNLTKEQYKNWNFSNFKLKNIDDKEEFERISKNILNPLKRIKDMVEYSKDPNKVFSYTIIYSLNNFKENNNEKEFIKKLFQDILNPITSNYYLPFFIFLAKDIEEKDEFNKFLELDEIQKPDERNISCFIFDKENNSIENKIFKIYAFFFEKGDEFDFEDKKIELYKKPNETLFYINILTLGKTQVGKSTFINTLLKEKKAREGGEGSSVTSNQISYHVDNVPLIINDIEGFTGEENIKIITDKICLMQKNLGEKEIHLVIYIIDYNGPTFFNENEYSIFEQLASKDDITQFIFICSKCPSKIDEKKVTLIQNSFFRMIKKGLEKEKKAQKNLIDVLNYLYYCQ